ncbi:MAG TPA: class I tRNA ligase family protein [Umezawaea sp.]|nr:class I tRNA ligase family protein [Umezawaea sp.]
MWRVRNAPSFTPLDHTVVTHMLHYDGAKLSTSKRHGIWITHLIDNTDITTDELRWCLAHLPLDHGVADLTADVLCTTINQLRAWCRTRLRTALRAADPATPGVLDTAQGVGAGATTPRRTRSDE